MVDSNAMRKTFVVPDIKPLDLYDCTRAKICASVGWVLAKSYANAEHVPVELREPFYCDQYEQEHLKPPVTRLLLSSELYCRTYGLLQADQEGSGAPKDNATLLQLLANRGVTPKDQDVPVTDADLRHKPIKMSAHLAVMDALMSVGAMETVSAVRMSGAATGEELLGGVGGASWENTLLHWVNGLNQRLREQTEGAQGDPSQDSTEPQPVQPSCPTRWYWKLVPIRYRKDKMLSKQKPTFPVVTEVKDLSNGCAIAAVVHYYCPGLLQLEDVCMKESMAVEDSLYNLQLIREFCDSCLKSCCPLVLEDLLYSPHELQVNMMSFLAELLGWFEVRRPEFVQPLNTTDASAPLKPTSLSNNSGSPSIFKKPFLPISSPVSPGPAPASLTQSASMSHVERAGRTWTKKPFSRPLSSAVSFSIPFGLDSDVDVVMGGAITRSVSSDNVAPGQTITRVPYTPPEDLSHLLSKPPAPPGSHRGSWATQSSSVVPMLLKENGLGEGDGDGELPTIEEALQIIHNEDKMEPRLHPDGAADGFFLHSPDDPASTRRNGRAAHSSHPPNPIPLSCSAPSRSGMMYHPHLPMGGKTQAPREQASSTPFSRTRHTSEGSRDDDSVLRDGSVDSDASEDLLLLPNAQSTPATPAVHTRSCGGGADAPDSGVRMTSFAERKKKPSTVGVSPNSGSASCSEPVAPAATAPMTSWVVQPQKSTEESPSKSPGLTTEMSELGARLDEKRKAIEAQKKRIEAIFAKHRQRLGKSAFLQLKKEQGVGEREEEEGGQVSASSTEEDLRGLTLEERLARMEDEEQQEVQQQEKRRLSLEQEGNIKPSSHLDNKQASLPRREKGAGAAGPGGEQVGVVARQPAPLGEYNNAVSKLNAALSSLQNDMQRLSEQQNQLIRKKPATPAGNKSWVIPPSLKSSAPPPTRMSRTSTPRDLASASSSPSSSRRNAASPARTSKSPQVQRRAQSVPPKSPKHQATHYHHARPQDLKVPGLSRVLTPPQNVDTIPHLRRASPWQCRDQNSSTFNISSAPSPASTPIPSPAPTPTPRALSLALDDNMSDAGSNEDQSIFSIDLDTATSQASGRKEHGGGGSSGAPSECSFESDVPAAGVFNGKRSSLIEISLSALCGEEDDLSVMDDSMSDVTEPEMKGGVGFFFKDDKVRPEDEMAQRKAALMEKQQKRAEEMKRRRLEQEEKREKEHAIRPEWFNIEGWGDKCGGSGEDRPQTPGTPPSESTTQRRDTFTRQEYERRQQLKIMEDLDKVLRQKPTTVRGVKKQRPKTMFRDDSVLSRSPAKGFMGSKLNKVYSHSTMNLSSMANDTGNSGTLTVRKSPSRSHSPSRLMSPGRMANQNGEKDWENASTASSPASIPEYTGPKLYKEPSFKSNKFIIHNAISRCCLAGKVNEPQKNKIVEEMEKCQANHFLILFRDSSCQFRAVYTMNPETEEMVRLTGIGPRVISPAMVESIYKYSSDRKQFTTIPSKTMSMSVDAFTIPGHLWQSKRPGTPKKLGTPK
ncbi:calmodulin-regulated spectrin-associated protein 3 isoform X1 [Oncorhynchus kisutch]|uniref:Calmodulin regulated spectrin associated protein family member 3 n=1 Tax=Oncorhynchus kisutch TaxID=8019 RepID=A0A8C7CVM3_ONCKI|nr:calmodulin-regulated spectrin-associated protein 3-like isoform X1 [Oncorhynchus kisutch]